MRLIQFAILLCLCLICFTGCASDSSDVLTVAAPFGPLAYPLVYLDQSDPDIRLVVWQNPEQLRAMVAGNQADLYAVPSKCRRTFLQPWGTSATPRCVTLECPLGCLGRQYGNFVQRLTWSRDRCSLPGKHAAYTVRYIS